MTFRELLERLSHRIGHHQIPLNPAATELRGLVDSGAVHYELITQIVTAIYTGNRCRRLADTVTRDTTFEALEPIRLAVLRSPKTDVDAYALMDRVGAEVAHAFGPTRGPLKGLAAISFAQVPANWSAEPDGHFVVSTRPISDWSKTRLV